MVCDDLNSCYGSPAFELSQIGVWWVLDLIQIIKFSCMLFWFLSNIFEADPHAKIQYIMGLNDFTIIN